MKKIVILLVFLLLVVAVIAFSTSGLLAKATRQSPTSTRYTALMTQSETGLIIASERTLTRIFDGLYVTNTADVYGGKNYLEYADTGQQFRFKSFSTTYAANTVNRPPNLLGLVSLNEGGQHTGTQLII